MLIYAGIDEAGYGPLFGPLLVGRTVIGVEAAPTPGSEALDAFPATPNLWSILKRAVCKTLTKSRGRIAVNDSKKLHSSGDLKHLERGVLAFAGVLGSPVASVDRYLDALGETCHHDLAALPWYAPTQDWPWDPLPRSCTIGEIAVARSMLASAMNAAGVKLLDLGAAVVFEDRFNRMVAATRSRAATSFTFVAGHLQSTWQRFGRSSPVVVVDRQGGRSHYRELLAMNFPDANLRILDEDERTSSYLLRSAREADRQMLVRFTVEAESAHLPVAVASMVSKYTRELLMARFQTWFARRLPDVAPTAGYASDAKRFWQQIEPALPDLQINPAHLLRISGANP